MNWEAVGAVGEVFGATVVVATMFYLAMQIRENKRSNQMLAATRIAESADSWIGQIVRDEKLNEIIANEGASRIGKDTLIIVDPTDIRKEYAGKMPYLATIHDGSSGKISTGYSGCMAVACEPRRRKAEDLPSIQPCAYHSSQEKDVL